MSLTTLLEKVRDCRLCANRLPSPRPILQAASSAKLLIVGQAPGLKVHTTGIPWNDPSGDCLREWLRMDKKIFYDASQIAIIPTGLCYPGKGKTGDLPPRPECAPLWHPQLLEYLPNIRLKLLIGQYAQHFYLKEMAKKNLTETVRAWREYLPDYFPLPHPSPRNRLWLSRNPWFASDVLPQLQIQIAQLSVFSSN